MKHTFPISPHLKMSDKFSNKDKVYIFKGTGKTESKSKTENRCDGGQYRAESNKKLETADDTYQIST